MGGIKVDEREEFVKKWGFQRQRGRVRYVLLKSGIGGLAAIIGLFLGDLLLSNFSPMIGLRLYLLSFFVSLLVGIQIHTKAWNKNEEEYNKAT